MTDSTSSLGSRRRFLKTLAGSAALLTSCQLRPTAPSMKYKISLAEWSLHRALLAKEIDHLDIPRIARGFDLDAVEYVSTFFKNRVTNSSYLTEMRARADAEGVQSLLIMCDGYGQIGNPDKNARRTAVENHFPLLDAAKFLGCHSIRVNAASSGTPEEQQKLAADGLTQLAEAGAKQNLHVIVENHGGLSSNGAWLAGVMKAVGMENCGTLPDFGNFQLEKDVWYDRYQGVAELMPFAKAVSAKTHEFDANGWEVHTDYSKMMRIVLDAGYQEYVGIEYEGSAHSEMDGIRLTRDLLRRYQ